jgi:pectin methylesterase-like acyl-CoA thioesterase
MEPSEKAYAIADEVVLGALGVGNAAQVIQRALDEAAAKERAKVVAWLRGGAGTDTTQLPRSTRALFLRGLHGYADAIEQGAHHDPE